MSEKRLFKEYKQYRKNPPSLAYPQILDLFPINEDHIHSWKAIIAKPTKEDSPYYYNGQWELHIDVANDYPIKPPKIRFATPIHHPNINVETGEICLDILKDESWSPAWNLQHLVQAILMLIDDPEPDSPLNIDSANLFRYDKTAFTSLVQYTMWENNTFYNGTKKKSGEKEQDEESGDEETKKSNNDFTTPQDSRNSRAFSMDANRKVIHDVGEEVTKQFIAKVDEISHELDSSGTSSPVDYSGFNPVREQVAKTVTKQVEDLFSRTEGSTPEIQEEVRDENIERIRQQFIDSVEAKVHEHMEHSIA